MTQSWIDPRELVECSGTRHGTASQYIYDCDFFENFFSSDLVPDDDGFTNLNGLTTDKQTASHRLNNRTRNSRYHFVC